jgi:hypothetical protein
MNLQIRLVAIADNGQEQVHEIASLQRTKLQLETLGLTLAEGKTILQASGHDPKNSRLKKPPNPRNRMLSAVCRDTRKMWTYRL